MTKARVNITNLNGGKKLNGNNMKFKKVIIGPNDKPRYWCATSPEEMRLLQGIVETALRFFPHTFETSIERGRLTGICECLRKMLGYAHKPCKEDLKEWDLVKDKLND